MLYKRLFVFIFALLLASCAPMTKLAVLQPSSPEFGKAAAVAFIRVSASDKLPRRAGAYCTGVWINKDTLLTALHCARAAARMAETAKLPPELQPLAPLLVGEVKDPTGYEMVYIVEDEVTGIDTMPKATHSSKIVAIDIKDDLAIVKAVSDKMPDHTWLPVANYNPKVGDKVSVVGHPSGLYFTFFNGMVSAIRETMPHADNDETSVTSGGPYVQVFSGIWHGNSGGPVISEKGEIVGIVSFGYSAPSQGFCIAPSSIKRFIIETYRL